MKIVREKYRVRIVEGDIICSKCGKPIFVVYMISIPEYPRFSFCPRCTPLPYIIDWFETYTHLDAFEAADLISPFYAPIV